jgi:hypothetical protein
MSMVVLLRDPHGRPAGLPLWPFCHCMVFFLWFAMNKTAARGRMRARAFMGALHAAMKKARGGSPGLSTQFR